MYPTIEYLIWITFLLLKSLLQQSPTEISNSNLQKMSRNSIILLTLRLNSSTPQNDTWGFIIIYLPNLEMMMLKIPAEQERNDPNFQSFVFVC